MGNVRKQVLSIDSMFLLSDSKILHLAVTNSLSMVEVIETISEIIGEFFCWCEEGKFLQSQTFGETVIYKVILFGRWPLKTKD